MIKLDDKTVGIWFMNTTPTSDWLCSVHESDWLCSVHEIEPDQKYEINYRFRYYEDTKVFDSKDRKSWYRAEGNGTRNYVIGVIRAMIKEMRAVEGVAEPYELINDGDFDKFWAKLQKAPFAYMRQVSKEEAAKMMEEQHEETRA